MTTHSIPFTSEVPKAEGAYWWRANDKDVNPVLIQLEFQGKDLLAFIAGEDDFHHVKALLGEFSEPLIPTYTLKTAVKEAWEEGVIAGFDVTETVLRTGDHSEPELTRLTKAYWSKSNARKIVEGEE